ncbi:MAG: MATE family efflux transporter [Bacillota bacterium]|nr:MATE family efflux transporter [Bacillota bacterium]
MGININIFEKGSMGKLLVKFAIPSIFALLVLELYNMVDTVYAGKFLGPNAIASLTVTFPIQRLIIAVGLLVAVGGSTYAARSFGEKNLQEVKKIIITSFCLTFLVSAAVSCIIAIFRIPILYALGASKATFPLAQSYISIILMGGIFQSLSVVICYIMVSLGKTRTTLYANLIGVILNIIINQLLLGVFNMGIQGAAIATVISQIASFIYACIEFKAVKKNFNIKLSASEVSESVSKEILKEIVTIGFSTFVIEIADAVVAVVLNNILSVIGGDSAIVISGLITKISMFMFVTIIGISSAVQPIIAYNYGAKNYSRIKEVLFAAIKTVISTSLILWAVLMIFAPQIAGFLLKDVNLLNDTVSAFRICISLLPFVGVYYIGIYYFQAVGEAKKSFLFSIFRETLVFIPLVILFSQLFGVKGVWITYPVTDAIVSLTSMIFLYRDFRVEFRAMDSLNNAI